MIEPNMTATMPKISPFRLALCLTLAFALALSSPSAAFAVVVDSPMGLAICSVLDIVFGNLGRATAVIAIMSVGIGGILGKVSWGMGLIVMAGISITFGAFALAEMITDVSVSCP